MGTNDRGFTQPIDIENEESQNSFYGAYLTMLKKIKRNYPLTKIVCATLPNGRLHEDFDIDYDRFMRMDIRYDEAIKKAVKKENCLLADLAGFGERYETLDYCHPTKRGHKTIATFWLKELKKLL